MPASDSCICPDVTADEWAQCTALARTYGKSFYMASRFLPSARRRAIHAVYAFCRTADDIVDLASCPETASAALDAWAAQLDVPAELVPRAFAAAREQYAIPVKPAHELINGIRRDLNPALYATWPELRQYCYEVAGTVGLLVAPVLGCKDDGALPQAAQLGIAMQLTNILRDVAEDAAVGRMYLPLSELAMFGCDPQSVLSGRPNGNFDELIAFQITRARELYRDARRGIYALPASSRATTLAASHFYSGILNEIEAMRYDVFRQRAHVSASKKVRSLPRIAASFIQLSLRFG